MILQTLRRMGANVVVVDDDIFDAVRKMAICVSL